MQNKFLLVLLLAGTIFTNACKKTDNIGQENEAAIVERLFPANKTNDLDLKIIMQEAITENTRKHFATGFVNKNGYINWGQTEKIVSPEGTAVIAPFAFDNSRASNGLLICLLKPTGTVTFKFLYRQQLKTQPSGNLQSLLDYFDHKQFNSNKINYVSAQQVPQRLKEKFPGENILEQIKPTYRIAQNNSASRTECITYLQIIDYCYVPSGEYCDCDEDSEYYQYSLTETQQYCYNTFDEWITPQGWDAGTSGGGSGWNPQIQLAYQLNGIMLPGDSYAFDNNLNPSQCLSFPSVSDFNNFLITNAANQQADLTEPGTEINQTQKLQYGKFNLTFIGGVRITAKLEKAGNVWNLLTASSTEYGVTLGWSWEAGEYTQTTVGNEIIMIAEGFVKYNVIVESIGTVFKQHYKFELRFNKLTGNIFSLAKL